MLGLFFAHHRRAGLGRPGGPRLRADSCSGATRRSSSPSTWRSIARAGRRSPCFVFVGMLELLGAPTERAVAPAVWLAALAAALAADVLSRTSRSFVVISLRSTSWDSSRRARPHPGRRRGRHHRRHRPGAGDRAGPASRARWRWPCSAVLAVLSFAALPRLPRAAAALRPARAALPVHPVGRPGAAERVGAWRPCVAEALRAAAGPQRHGRALCRAATPTPGGRRPATASRCCARPRSDGEPGARRCCGTTATSTRWPRRCATAARSPACLLVTDRLDDVSTFDREDAQAVRGAGRPRQRRADQLRPGRRGSAPPPQETEHLSLHDPLTGLPNRLHFQQRLERRLLHRRFGRRAADGPRPVQGGQRHPRARRRRPAAARGRPAGCRQVERGETVVARLGGDEFAVLLGGDDVHIEGMVAAHHPRHLPARSTSARSPST